jgi:CheY-like chemotaxis protein
MMAARKRVLVVDDDDPIRTMLAKVVERFDVDVDTARDGEEAIEAIDHDAYSAILLDLMMPRVDGFAVLRYLKEHNPAMLRCTIVASAVPESEALRRVGVPIYRFHAKPFDISRLLEDVGDCVGHA